MDCPMSEDTRASTTRLSLRLLGGEAGLRVVWAGSKHSKARTDLAVILVVGGWWHGRARIYFLQFGFGNHAEVPPWAPGLPLSRCQRCRFSDLEHEWHSASAPLIPSWPARASLPKRNRCQAHARLLLAVHPISRDPPTRSRLEHFIPTLTSQQCGREPDEWWPGGSLSVILQQRHIVPSLYHLVLCSCLSH